MGPTGVSIDYAGVWQAVRSGHDGAGLRAVLSVPVRVREQTIGTLNAFRSAPGRWRPDQIRACTAYAGIIGILLRLGAG